MRGDHVDRTVEYLRRVTAELRGARARIAELEAPDPIAIVGMGCRLPGASSPSQLWELVHRGEDAIGRLPRDRGWDPALETSAWRGGFLDGATEFDAAFFGISPREAAAMDLEQRLLLEVAWQALEHAGIDPHAVRGTAAGIFVGTYRWGYRELPATENGHALTGTAASVLSGRLAYTFGTEGPALTIDTACSSSLVALHTAVRSLRSGESTLALACGATVLSDPAVFAEFERQGGLAGDGRCKAFGADADGTGWAEGVGVLVLERLTDARRSGHPVLALVRGTAVNSDGASNGITAPNGRAQKRVIRRALADAGLSPADIDVVEAHGTGTRLGDPIEARALLETYGSERAEPVLIGSLKSNIGHAQAASGVAGVIKVVEALRHGSVPATLHAGTPSERIDWSAGSGTLPQANTPWPETKRPRRAAVSAFGISGTNAHVVLEQAPEEEPVAEHPRVLAPLLVTARTATALERQLDQAGRTPGDRLDVGFSLAAGRARLPHRAVLLRSGEPVRGVAAAVRPLAVLFPGQGAQRPGVGRELHSRFSVFAEVFDALLEELGLQHDAVWNAGGAELDRTGTAQRVLFALAVAQYRLLESWGLSPACLAGHSIGELAAVHVAGVLDEADACRLVAGRADLMQALPPGGAMAAVAAPEAEVSTRLCGGVVVAAVNGPASTVISGVESEVLETAGKLADAGYRTSRLRVSHAFHSPLMDPVLAPFEQLLAGVRFQAPRVPVISTLTGRVATAAELASPTYWVRQLREPVRFADAVATSAAEGASAWLELGPGATLTALAGESLPSDALVVPLLPPGEPEELAAVTALSRLHTAGVEADFTRLWDGTGARRVPVPVTVFEPQAFPPPGAIPTAPRYHETLIPRHFAPAPPGRWLVVAPHEADPEVTARVAAALGAPVTGPDEVAGRRDLTGVVSLLALDETTDDAGVPSAVVATAELLRRLDCPLWCVTRGPTHAGAAVRGLGLVAALEVPDRWGGLIDLEEDFDPQSFAAALAGDEPEVVLGSGGTFARRIVPAEHAAHGRWRPSGTILITGGTGALGAHAARDLARRGADHLVLLSRRGQAAPGAGELRAELTALGAGVSIIACDVADRADLTAVLRDLPPGYPLTGVVHAAGVLDDGVLDHLEAHRFTAVFRAKVASALLLDELTRDRRLDAFVLYSSISAVVGNPGQAVYAAANATLHALAERRRAEGLPATAIAWGAWEGTGMAASAAAPLGWLSPARAVTALSIAPGESRPTVVVADLGDPAGFGTHRARLLGAAVTSPSEPLLRQRVLAVPEAERAAVLLAGVQATAAAVLGHARPDALSAGSTFRDSGFDSLTAVELRNRLMAELGMPLPTGVVFDHPTPRQLATRLERELSGHQDGEATVTSTGPADDPIAVIGMACRLPGGADTPERLWEHLVAGLDAIGPLPDDRDWDLGLFGGAAPEGGFLGDALDFDASFFGITPREAMTMDPQQRVLLEVAWEAMERSTLVPAELRGSQTGVFVGTNGQDYVHVVASSADESGAPHAATGVAASVLSGRLSYAFAFEGPSITVDTACSSSLVALHQAVRALRAGDCGLALAGGATIMTDSASYARIARIGAIASDGRAKAFSEHADGTGYAEGAAVVVLERLSDARRAGHPVLAVVRGSAVNADGASNGLTAPNGPSQQRVILSALADARLAPSDVDVVEAHGTGTRLGDPIEAEAVLATYGRERERPVSLGSLKSNIGHTQAAAGVAGVLKMVLALRNGVLPRTLHVDEPTTRVDWSAGTVRLLTEAKPWHEGDRPRRAGVSAFGISGTNAHVILEEAPPEPPAAPEPGPELVPWVVSAKSATGLDEQLARLREAATEQEPGAVGWSLISTRTLFPHRTVVLGGSSDELLAGIADGVRGIAVEHARKPVFVFPGQGAQWWGMGRDLLAQSTVFRGVIVCCADALAPHVDWSLLDLLRGDGDQGALERADVLQPALFSMMVAVAALWQAHGVEPGAVVGHSQGEIAAAYVAGALSLEDAAKLVAMRSRTMLKVAGRGGLLSVAAPADRVEPLLRRWDGRLSLAVVNGPSAVVVSGDLPALEEFKAECALADVRAKWVKSDIAGHGPQVEVIRDELLEVLADIRPRAGTVPFYSTVTGGRLDTAALDAGYWYRNLRQLVRLDEATRSLVADGFDTFVESNPHPLLGPAIEETAAAAGTAVTVLGSLRRDQGDFRRFATALAEAQVSGVEVEWRPLFGPAPRHPVALPTHAFQRRRFWPGRTSPQGSDSGFWRLVEAGDPAALAVELDTDPESVAAVLPALSRWREQAEQRSVVSGWCYREEWARLPDTVSALAGRVLVLVPRGSADDPWIARVTAVFGEEAVCAETVPPGDFTAIVSLLGLSTEPDDAGVPHGLAETLALVQRTSVPVWCVTRGAVAAVSGDQVPRPEQATLWGFGRVAALELPDSWGGLIDLPEELDAQTVGRLPAVLACGEDQVAIRSSGSFGRRLVRAAPGGSGRWRTRGAVLITGGTGGIGRQLTRWAAARGAKDIVLTGRRGFDLPELRAELAAQGVRVTIRACDVADRDALAAVVAEFSPTAVLHAAGVSEGDGPIADLSTERLGPLLRAKVAGARNLHELASGLDTLVLFSSGASAWGSSGQAGYAAANAYLDALAAHRRAQGLSATSISWGAWAGTGMVADAALAAELGTLGVLPMSPALAIDALERVLAANSVTQTVSAMEWARFIPTFTARRASPLLHAFTERAESAADTGDIADRLRDLPDAERGRLLLEVVRAAVAATGGITDEIPARRAFRDLGFDSVAAVDLRNRLRTATGLALPASLVFDHPTPAELAEHLKKSLFPETPTADPDDEVRRLVASVPIARLRRAGVLETVLGLAGDRSDENGSELDDLDGEDLLRLAAEISSEEP